MPFPRAQSPQRLVDLEPADGELATPFPIEKGGGFLLPESEYPRQFTQLQEKPHHLEACLLAHLLSELSLNSNLSLLTCGGQGGELAK